MSMQQLTKGSYWIFWMVCGLWLGLQSAGAFSLLGPTASWETPSIGYNPEAPDAVSYGPQFYTEEYRRNLPIIYYAYDANFEQYFGSNGVAAVESAISIMNGVTNVNSYSSALTEFPLRGKLPNFAAQNLRLTDLKSWALYYLVEQMGLAPPERYVWTLENRYVPPATPCPPGIGIEYLVLQMNYDITPSPVNQLQASAYINNVLFYNQIMEFCHTETFFAPGSALATTIPTSVDPLAFTYSTVAGDEDYWTPIGALPPGYFHTGLTRDDVAGLRYMLSTNNVNWEIPAPGSLFQATNDILHSIVLMTSNLTELALFATTNAPDVVQAAFPGVLVGSYTNYWTVQQIPNVVAYYTNLPGAPFGNPPTLVVTTNGFTPVPLLIYQDVFANLVINNYSSNTVAYRQTVTVSTPIGAPFGNPPTTNYSALSRVVLTNVPSGDYYIIPPGTCGYNIVSPLYTNVTLITNVLATQATTSTNASNGTNYTAFVNLITIFTNHWYVAEPCAFETPSNAWYQGVGRVRFVRIPDWNPVDPLTHALLFPITTNYTKVWVNVTNNQLVTRTFQRTVTTPDLLFDARDMPGNPTTYVTVSRNVNFDNQALPGLNGPGTIDPGATITFNSLAPLDYVQNTWGTNEYGTLIHLVPAAGTLYFGPFWYWASFGATTNDPVLYPNGTSIQNIINQMLIQVSPASLPDGTNTVAYSVTFSATGGQTSYTWVVASGTQLPNGLGLSPGGVLSGTPSGNPPGTYDFTIQLTDSSSPPRTVTFDYTITIH